ncbi:hypothetical protein R1sor_016106 [Riccia sorocarpa]|uniref:Uncharacterized protein n=1 Tax=Riccia sorocarpa TaxID=122646 RepID=A0ABD3HGT6_9MARC
MLKGRDLESDEPKEKAGSKKVTAKIEKVVSDTPSSRTRAETKCNHFGLTGETPAKQLEARLDAVVVKIETGELSVSQGAPPRFGGGSQNAPKVTELSSGTENERSPQFPIPDPVELEQAKFVWEAEPDVAESQPQEAE